MSVVLVWLDGDLVVVFDVDYVFLWDFLVCIVGYFVQDLKLFLVQMLYYFINFDLIQCNFGLKFLFENEMFYGMIYWGLDCWGGVFFCGLVVVIWCKVLDSVGGFVGEIIIEDVEIVLEIYLQGWCSLYLDCVMIVGLQLEIFVFFIQQCGCWVLGMVQMLVLKNLLFCCGLKLLQWLCYINLMFFWFFLLIWLVYMLVLLIYLFFGIEIVVMIFQEVMVYVFSYMVVVLLVQNVIFLWYCWLLILEVYEIVQVFYLVMLIIKMLLKLCGVKFNVIVKDEMLVEDYILLIYGLLVWLFVLMLVGVIVLIGCWIVFLGDCSVLFVVGVWVVINLLMVLLVLCLVFEKQQCWVVLCVELSLFVMVIWLGLGQYLIKVMVLDVLISGVQLWLDQVLCGIGVVMVCQGDEISFCFSFVNVLYLEQDVKVVVLVMLNFGKDGLMLGLCLFSDQFIVVCEVVVQMIFGDSEVWQVQCYVIWQGKGLIVGLFYIIGLMLWFFLKIICDFMYEFVCCCCVVLILNKVQCLVYLMVFGVDFDQEQYCNQFMFVLIEDFIEIEVQ